MSCDIGQTKTLVREEESFLILSLLGLVAVLSDDDGGGDVGCWRLTVTWTRVFILIQIEIIKKCSKSV